MYESVVNTVKECSDEMRGSIKMFQQNMEQMSDVSHEKFSAMTNSGQFLVCTTQLPYQIAYLPTFWSYKVEDQTKGETHE